MEDPEVHPLLHPGQFSMLTEHPIDRALSQVRRLHGYAQAAKGGPTSALEMVHAGVYGTTPWVGSPVTSSLGGDVHARR